MSLSPLAPAAQSADRPDRSRPVGVDSVEPGLRELIAVREIAQAFLTAQKPGDVYQFALDRVSPLVGASFACVYLIDGVSELMRLQAVHNWPERFAPFLGEMRVRLGSGPSGTAASERRMVEIPDVFADPSLEDWQEVANELGFRSLVALPLQTSNATHGAITFYFKKAGAVNAEGRGLLQVVADQMAATAEKARLIEDLARANTELQETNAELRIQYAALVQARRLQDEFLANVSHELRTPLTAVQGYISLMQEGLAGPITDEQQETLGQVKASSDKLLEMIGDLLDVTALKRGEVDVQVGEFDPRDALADALAAAPERRESVQLRIDQPQIMPRMASDRRKVTRLLGALIGNAFKFTERGEVRCALEVKDDHVVYRISDTGIGIAAEAQRFVFDEFRQEDGSATRRFGGSGLGLAIARRLARLLGGDVTLSSTQGQGSTFEAAIPLTYQPGKEADR